MATVILIDGWDYLESTYLTKSKNWSALSGSATVAGEAGRKGNGLRLVGAATLTSKTFTNIASPSIGHTFRINELVAKTVLTAKDGATAQWTWEMSAGGNIIVRNGAGTVLGTSAISLNTGEFYHVEVYAPIGNSVTVTLLINGDPGLGFQASGINTNMSGNLRINQIVLGDLTGTTVDVHLDDLYVVDNTAPTGVRFVDTFYPSGGVAGWGQWSVSGGAGSLYQAISETPPDENTSYIYTNAAGSTLAFFSELEDIRAPTSGGGTIDAIQIHTLAAKGTSLDRKYRIGWWPNPSAGSVNINYGPEIAAVVDYEYGSLLLGPVPGTLAGWGPDTLNALRIGGRRTL